MCLLSWMLGYYNVSCWHYIVLWCVSFSRIFFRLLVQYLNVKCHCLISEWGMGSTWFSKFITHVLSHVTFFFFFKVLICFILWVVFRTDVILKLPEVGNIYYTKFTSLTCKAGHGRRASAGSSLRTGLAPLGASWIQWLSVYMYMLPFDLSVC